MFRHSSSGRHFSQRPSGRHASERPSGRHSSQPQHPSPRYQPFQRPTALIPRKNAFSAAFHDLQQLNGIEGKLCSWGHGLSNDWDEVPRCRLRLFLVILGAHDIYRPQRATNRGLVDVAASGFGRLKNPILLFCPHTKHNGQPYQPLRLRIGARYEGGIADFYQADDHPCSFKSTSLPLELDFSLMCFSCCSTLERGEVFHVLGRDFRLQWYVNYLILFSGHSLIAL
jgi:hypothetical protein